MKANYPALRQKVRESRGGFPYAPTEKSGADFTPEEQQAFAASRGWGMRMLSNGDSGFTEAPGFAYEQDGKTWQVPGYSTLRKAADGTITRIAKDAFGPGDFYNPVWHMFPLLDGGVDGWQPRIEYGS